MDDAFLKEVLECSVCLEQLTLNSKVLPCQHTFCRRCLEEIVASKGKLLCPECRLPVDRPIAELPNNILLARLLEGMRQKRNAVALEERRRQADVAQVSFPAAVDVPRRVVVDRTRSEAAAWIFGEAVDVVPAVPFAHVVTQQEECVEKFPAKALALYSFAGPEKDDLKFSKGDLLTLISRVDANWYWAERASAAGLVPANYVQTLCMEKSVPGIAIFDFQKDSPARQYLKFNRILSDSVLSSPVDGSPRRRPVPEQREATPSSTAGTVAPPSSPRKYVALYNYWPKGKDELELFRGHLYTVQDKCPDGWFRGCCVSTGKSGLFPGNYVRPRSSNEDSAPPPVVPGPSRLKFTSPDRQPSVAMSQSVPSPGRSLSCRCREPAIEAGPEVGMRRMSADVLELSSSISSQNSSPGACVAGGSVSSSAGETKSSGKSHNWERKSSCGRKTLISGGSGLFSRLARLSGHSNSSTQSSPPVAIPPPPPTQSAPRQHPPMRQVYRCVIPYPADSVQELELHIGDIVLLKERRSDGWMFGQLQRSGKVGLFPSSFVELCGNHKASLSTS